MFWATGAPRSCENLGLEARANRVMETVAAQAFVLASTYTCALMGETISERWKQPRPFSNRTFRESAEAMPDACLGRLADGLLGSRVGGEYVSEAVQSRTVPSSHISNQIALQLPILLWTD